MPAYQPTLRAVVSTSSSGVTEIVAAVPGAKIVVINYGIVVAGATAITWRSASTSISGALSFAGNGGISCSDADHGWFETAVGEALNINNSAAVAVGGHVSYLVIR